MHILKDENGVIIPHGPGEEGAHPHSHEHEHTHVDEHGNPYTHSHAHHHEGEHAHEHSHCSHNCSSGCAGEEDCTRETVALLSYMLDHNQHHAAELDQMADNLVKLGMDSAAKQIKEAVSDFQKGNMRLAMALATVKEQL